MAGPHDVARIALSLPGVVQDGLSFRANGRLIAWPWLERLHPKKARVPNPNVLVLRVASEMDKHALVDLDPEIFFTEPHFDGYAAVQVRLAAVDEELLTKLISDSWALASSKPKRRARRG
jgi:hypothetical protein